MSTWLQASILTAQAVFYFTLSLILDKKRRGKICSFKSNPRSPQSWASPISVTVAHHKRKIEYGFEVQKGRVAALYGPTESGKSELVNLLAGIQSSAFTGKCSVMGSSILEGDPLPTKQVGVCLDEDYLEESFTLFYHLSFVGQLRGLSNQQIAQQIFYLSKLLDMEEHLFKKIKHLSGGNKRKAALSAALLGAPPLLIIDEPTRSLDPAVSR